MKYVESALLPNEHMLYSAKITKFVYAPGVFGLAMGPALTGIGISQGNEGAIIGALGLSLLVATPLSLLAGFLQRNTTELAITTKRIIFKRGLISRNTIELNHTKVESYHVDQDVFGRIFNYGTLTINGTGGIKTPIKNIDSPLEFRKKAIEIIDTLQSK